MTEMRLNTLPSIGTRQRKRLGRGIGSGLGKTSGKGHKGQRARSGGRRDGNFEGGQMPLHRRVPKRGFNSRLAKVTMELRLDMLNKLPMDEITMDGLIETGIIPHNIKRVKFFCSGEVTRAVKLINIPATKGAIMAIEKAGGQIVSDTK